MYYDSIQNDIGAERAFLEANRLNVATPSSVDLAGQAGIPTEVDGSVSETGPEEPVSEGAPRIGVSEDQKLADVHGKNISVFFFHYDREAKNIRLIWCIVPSNNLVPLLSDVNSIWQHSPLLVLRLLKNHFQESMGRTKGKQKDDGQ